MVLIFAAVSLAFLVGVVAAAAVDGFPAPQPVAQGTPRHQGSVVGEIAGTDSFLLVLAGFVWWRVRRDMAE